jgi:hypothetical protein
MNWASIAKNGHIKDVCRNIKKKIFVNNFIDVYFLIIPFLDEDILVFMMNYITNKDVLKQIKSNLHNTYWGRSYLLRKELRFFGLMLRKDSKLCECYMNGVTNFTLRQTTATMIFYDKCYKYIRVERYKIRCLFREFKELLREQKDYEVYGFI